MQPNMQLALLETVAIRTGDPVADTGFRGGGGAFPPGGGGGWPRP